MRGPAAPVLSGAAAAASGPGLTDLEAAAITVMSSADLSFRVTVDGFQARHCQIECLKKIDSFIPELKAAAGNRRGCPLLLRVTVGSVLYG